jgi:predicted  nucleic acid-binding Zn-ribbon protein
MPRMQLSNLFETNEEKIEELTIDLMQIEKEARTLKTRIDNLQNNIKRLEQLLRDSQIEFQFITSKINDRLDWLEIQTKKKQKIFSD